MSVVPKVMKHDGVTTTGYFAGCRKEAAKALKAPPPPLSMEMLARRMRPQHPHTRRLKYAAPAVLHMSQRHRWRFEEPNGPLSRGQCFCGRVKFRPTSSYLGPRSIHIDLSPTRPRAAVTRG